MQVMSSISALFGFRGRLSVLEYWGYSIFIGFAAGFGFAAYAGRVVPWDELVQLCQTFLEHPEDVDPALLWGSGIFFWSLIAIKVKRLHDLNLPGWWSVFWCVPLTLGYLGLDLAKAAVEDDNRVFMLFALVLSLASVAGSVWQVWINIQEMFFAGDDQPNDYGAAPGTERYDQPVAERIAPAAQVRRINGLNPRY
jgi:uncharacterized membrane protein YhaH (DUF805 family)